MNERLFWGIILIFLAITVQNRFFAINPDISAIPTKSSALILASKPSWKQTEARVVRIIDGDTIVVAVNGIEEKIRLIGVDTPELVDPRGSTQCTGVEATEFTKSILKNRSVRIVTDTSQDNRDKYGRLLRYVFLDDGTFVNEKIIALGYGKEYTYRRPHKYQAEFRNAERHSREEEKGLWAVSVCDVTNKL